MAKLSTKDRNDMEDGAFAFPKERKEPLERKPRAQRDRPFNQIEGRQRRRARRGLETDQYRGEKI